MASANVSMNNVTDPNRTLKYDEELESFIMDHLDNKPMRTGAWKSLTLRQRIDFIKSLSNLPEYVYNYVRSALERAETEMGGTSFTLDDRSAEAMALCTLFHKECNYIMDIWGNYPKWRHHEYIVTKMKSLDRGDMEEKDKNIHNILFYIREHMNASMSHEEKKLLDPAYRNTLDRIAHERGQQQRNEASAAHRARGQNAAVKSRRRALAVQRGETPFSIGLGTFNNTDEHNNETLRNTEFYPLLGRGGTHRKKHIHKKRTHKRRTHKKRTHRR
jgi:hypothetical protein